MHRCTAWGQGAVDLLRVNRRTAFGRQRISFCLLLYHLAAEDSG